MKYIVIIFILSSIYILYSQDIDDDNDNEINELNLNCNAYILTDSVISLQIIVENTSKDSLLVPFSNWIFTIDCCRNIFPTLWDNSIYNFAFFYPDKFKDIEPSGIDGSISHYINKWPMFMKLKDHEIDTIIIKKYYNPSKKDSFLTPERYDKLYTFCNSKININMIYYIYNDLAKLIKFNINDIIIKNKEDIEYFYDGTSNNVKERNIVKYRKYEEYSGHVITEDNKSDILEIIKHSSCNNYVQYYEIGNGKALEDGILKY